MNVIQWLGTWGRISTFHRVEWMVDLEEMIGQWRSRNIIFDIFHEKIFLKGIHWKASLNFSAWPIESNDINFEKLGRRIEHITNLNADASKGYSEPYMVSIDSTSNVLWTFAIENFIILENNCMNMDIIYLLVR